MHELLPLPNTSELQNTLFKGTRRHPLELVGKQWFSAKMPPKPPETKNPPGTAAQSRARLRKKTSSPRKKTSSPRNHAQSWNSWNFLIISNGFCWWRIQQAKKPQNNGFPTNASDLFFSTPPTHIQQIVGKPKTLASKPISVVERQKLYVGKPKTL